MIRYLHVLLTFLLAFIVQFARNVYTIVVLRMVDKKTPGTGTNHHHDLDQATCLANQVNLTRSIDIVVNVSETVANSQVEMFDWNEKQVGMLQSAYFIGYMGTMMIGANTVLRVLGQFKGILVLLALNLIVFASFPTLTIKFGFVGALIARIGLGAVHGPVTSIIAASFFTWIPPSELTLATTISTLGAGAGAPIANIYAGSLLEKGASWEEAYLSMTSISLVILVIYALVGDEGPEGGQKSVLNLIRPMRLSNWISGAERDLIVNSRLAKSTKDVPYTKIYKSRAVLVFTLSWFFTAMTINMFVTLPPRYAINTMFAPISLYAKVSAIQGPATIPIIIFTSAITDRCRAKFGTVTTRRRVHLIFSILIVVSFLPVLIWPCASTFNLVMIGTSFFMLGVLMACSIKPVPNELSGPYAGQVYAFANAVSNLGNFLAPIIAGGLLDMGPVDHVATWYPVFLLGLACVCLSTLIYHCARYDLQDWAGEQHYVYDEKSLKDELK